MPSSLDDTVRKVWNLTRTGRKSVDDFYARQLHITVHTKKSDRFADPFYVVKPNNRGKRKIVPAAKILRFVHSVLARWLFKLGRNSRDFCYTGKGVLAAVTPHIGSTVALVIDLKSAFDYVKRSKLRFTLKQLLLNEDDSTIDMICDLLTFRVYEDESTPQGCITTPYAYNLVMAKIDQSMELLKKRFKGLKITRYSDNICLSSEHTLNLVELEKATVSIIRAYGFEISWSKRFTEPPFEYLGTLIYSSKLGLDLEKYGEYLFVMIEALESSIPNSYRKRILGIFNWAYHVCGENMPDDLLLMFQKYFERVQRPPKKLLDLVTKRLNPRLF